MPTCWLSSGREAPDPIRQPFPAEIGSRTRPRLRLGPRAGVRASRAGVSSNGRKGACEIISRLREVVEKNGLSLTLAIRRHGGVRGCLSSPRTVALSGRRGFERSHGAADSKMTPDPCRGFRSPAEIISHAVNAGAMWPLREVSYGLDTRGRHGEPAVHGHDQATREVPL